MRTTRRLQRALVRLRLEQNEAALRRHLHTTLYDAAGREPLYVERYRLADRYLSLGGTVEEIL